MDRTPYQHTSSQMTNLFGTWINNRGSQTRPNTRHSRERPRCKRVRNYKTSHLRRTNREVILYSRNSRPSYKGSEDIGEV